MFFCLFFLFVFLGVLILFIYLNYFFNLCWFFGGFFIIAILSTFILAPGLSNSPEVVS